MDEIVDLLSQKRLAKYKGISKEDAFKCHLYNSELAESFYQSLCYFEIILRNKIDLVFSKYLGEDWIFDTQYHIGKNKKHYDEALKRIEREKGVEYLKNRDCLISELTFGYWSFLFSSDYKDVLWNKYPSMMKEIFDGNKDSGKLSKLIYDINRIRLYRNKVFHYGSLLVLQDDYEHPAHMYNIIYNLMRSLGAKRILKAIKEIDSFDFVYQKIKKLNILK
ncbi:MAG: hypothetical protein SO314_06775 [Alphaproteobacteria bacterium]|nr:hypothetical protein [Alphaproteobacteria bacterium]